MSESKDVQILDTNTANQIAAGEVVEKPASVVKELVENALDAGADKIDVTIFAGGTEYIRVTDNGSGMTEANAKLAVLRHATSKITAAEDLMQLHTLGFRGEALPSIASVANFNLITRTEAEDFATSIKIDGGENMECTSAGGNVGTTVIVENLFFNVPARRKFLKTVSTEGRYINELLTKLALSRPDVRFTLSSNDKEVLHTPGDNDLKAAIRSLYGKEVAEALLEVNFRNEDVKVSGYIGKPTLLKGTRQWQTLFVNGRMITSKMIGKAIDHAYQSQIPKSGFPFAVLNIAVDTHTIDVNVHPQKSEIKFSDESLIYKTVYRALTEALTRPMQAAKTAEALTDDEDIDFSFDDAASAQIEAKQSVFTPVVQQIIDAGDIFKTPEIKETAEQSFNYREEAKPQKTEYKGSYAAGSNKAYNSYGSSEQAPVYTINEVREAFKEAEPLPEPARENITFTDIDSGVDVIWPIGQVDKTFIIAQSEDSLYLIDQHAAHERILYDKLVSARDKVASQQLLIPVYVDVSEEDVALAEKYADEFLRLGVEADAGGAATLRISSLPADISLDDAEEFISEICKMLRDMRDINPSDLRQELLHMTACKAAIKAGQILNMRQMRQLIIDLCNTEHPFTCPHGRPCMIEINSDQLYKMFKRTGF